MLGLFYPDDEHELRDAVSAYLAQHQTRDSCRAAEGADRSARGLHLLRRHRRGCVRDRRAIARHTIRRIVLIGPSHRVYLRGMAAPAASSFATPLGKVAIDRALKTALLQRSDVVESDAPHAQEHCLEVQLPFLQMLFDEFTLLPLVLGSVAPEQRRGCAR